MSEVKLTVAGVMKCSQAAFGWGIDSDIPSEVSVLSNGLQHCIVLYLLNIPEHPYKAKVIGYRTCHST
jgi:hypothetical protein